MQWNEIVPQTAAGKKYHAYFATTVKQAQIEEWEPQTGQAWPRYAEGVVSASGNVARRAGELYDVHHIIESILAVLIPGGTSLRLDSLASIRAEYI